MTELNMDILTEGWVPVLPTAFENSVVLGAGRVLFPCSDPEGTAKILQEHIYEVALRAYRAGRNKGKEEIRKAIFE